MSDLEDRLAAHLNGKFFWEHTTIPHEDSAGEARHIRAVQKKLSAGAVHIVPARAIDPNLKMNSIKPMKIVLKGEQAAAEPILRAISEAYDVAIDDLLGKSTRRDLAPAKRHLCWALFRYIPNLSLPEAGRLLQKCHSTVLHSRDCFNRNQDYAKVVEVDKLMGRL